MCAVCIQEPEKRPEEGIRHPGTGFISGCEPLGGCWERSLGLSQKQ